jgi:protein tyrosine/serine phosphatase
MKKKTPTARLVVITLIVAAAALMLLRHFHVKDFCIIRPGVLYASGQPRGMDYPRLLYKYHIAAIVNIRSPSEHREQNWYNEEITWARSNGVKYIEMPIERGRYFPNEQIQDQFLAIMADKTNLPVLLHGSADDKRVAMLVAVWLEKVEGYTSEKTVEAVKKIIDDRELTNEEKEFINLLAK